MFHQAAGRVQAKDKLQHTSRIPILVVLLVIWEVGLSWVVFAMAG